MMDKKKQLIEELIAHLEGSQADDLMSLIQSKKPPEMDIPGKGISVEKIDVMKPKGGMMDGESEPGEDPKEESLESPAQESAEPGEGAEMSDDELASLLKEYLNK